MKQLFTLLLLSSAIFLSVGSYAQQKSAFNIKGTVVDTTSNSPAQFSTLSIAFKDQPDKQVKVLATDDKGNFQIGLSNPGEYILSVFYFGSKAADIPFTIKENQKITDLGTIAIANASQLEEAVVAAQKPLVKVELDKLTYDTESDPDSRTETALEMLRKVPMITVDAEDKIQLRGSSNFKVYVNGKPSTLVTNNPSEVLKSMPASNIKNIEVITDPGAKYDAEGIGGIINITMIKRTDDGYTATIGTHANTQGGYGGNAFLTLKQGKLGFSGNYGYNYWKRSSDRSESFLDNFTDNSRLTQFGRSSNKGPQQWGSGELSYEFDTLNMVSVSVSHHYGENTNNSTTLEALTGGLNPYSFARSTENTGEWGNTEVNANYQRSFKKKGMLLTGSYRYNLSPNDSKYETLISDGENYSDIWERSKNDASSNEHTFQVDYVNPLKNKHEIEVGAKYIIRLNDSDPFFEEYSYTTSTWNRNTNRENTMDYRQDIFSGYASYNYKLKKLGFKAGVRLENTETDINFKTMSDVQNSTVDIVPSAALSYQLGMTKTLRFNYNMRISRPSIWYLNPYRNESSPTNISYGNPRLDSEESHRFSLTYGSFSQKVNLNASLNYTITNNVIQQYAKMVNDVMETTYENLGKDQSVGLDLFASWMPIKDLRMMVNSSVSYLDIDTKSDQIGSNSGWGGNIFFNTSYTFLKSFRASVFIGSFKQPVTSQGEMTAFSFVGIGLGKDFFDKKLSIAVNVQDPFRKHTDITMKTYGNTFYQEFKYSIKQQNIGFRISYKFGNLKNQQIKKVQRGIKNDDLMQGGSNNASGAENTPATN